MHTDVYQAISDPTRRRMLDMLKKGEHTVTALTSPFDLSQPAVSKHLRVLREAGLVKARNDGKHRHYRLAPKPLKTVSSWISHYEHFWTDKLSRLVTHLDKKHPEDT